MRKHVYLIAAIVSGALVVSDCITNPYTDEHKVGKSTVGTSLGSLVGAGISALSPSKRDHGKGALIGAVAGVALGSGVGYYIDMQEARLRNKMHGTDVSVTRSRGNITLSIPNNVTFGSSGATLKLAGTNTLAGVAMVLKEYPKTAANVVGYADNTGGRNLNMRLSQQCTGSIISALITQGVDTSCIHTQGLGPTNPIASNSTVEGKTQNRRVEIILSPL